MDRTRPKTALIVGAFGQDGHYLSQHLVAEGYAVVGVGRDRIEGHPSARRFDLGDRQHVADFIADLSPAEIYYLAAFHHSSEQAPPPLDVLLEASMRVNFEGLVNVLRAVAARSRQSRVFFASSALVFGDAAAAPQSEATPLRPTTPYGVSKVAAMGACALYRAAGVFAASGILFNHESPRRGTSFVSRKIAMAAASAGQGRAVELRLGSLDARVDWSAAEDVVRAAHAMLQMNEPADCVIASGELHSVRDLARVAFETVGLDYTNYVQEDDSILHRPVAGAPRLGDPSLLKRLTGFVPKISFEGMVRGMVQAEMDVAA